jgi:hypothetical protein
MSASLQPFHRSIDFVIKASRATGVEDLKRFRRHFVIRGQTSAIILLKLTCQRHAVLHQEKAQMPKHVRCTFSIRL